MDKYTVDIDKILNDLEYSELTDHNDAVQDGKSDKNYAGAPTNQKVKQTNTKHSITNVFHSLNEYLNSDISVKSKILEGNINVQSESRNFVDNSNSDMAYQKNDAGVSTNHSLLDFETNQTIKDLQFIVERNNEQSNVQSVVVEQRESSEADKDICKEDLNQSCLEYNNANNGFPSDKIIEANNENESQEVCKESKEIISESGSAEEKLNIRLDAPENKETGFFHPTTEDYVQEIDNNPEITGELAQNEPSNPSKLENNDSGIEIKEASNEHEAPETNELLVNNTENLETSETCTDPENPQIQIDTPNVPGKSEPVSFDMIHVDDSELDKYLEEIESEYETEKAELEKEDAAEATEQKGHGDTIKCEEELTIAEEKTETNGERPTTLELENGDSKREIDLIGSPGSTPYNNVYINKEPSSESDFSSTSPTYSEESTEYCFESDANGEDGASKHVSIVSLKSDAEIAVETKVEIANKTDEELNAEKALWLGKQPPFWMPDADALNCQHCDSKFTVIKRRHHCRACGLVLCSKCCNLRHMILYLEMEARVCQKCYDILSKDAAESGETAAGTSNTIQPNPNKPMEYCSVVPPFEQVSNSIQNPPSVMVPVGVLKRKGSAKSKSNKSVMFCDGIRPGSDLTNLDVDFNYSQVKIGTKKQSANVTKSNKNLPLLENETKSFIPVSESSLPPTVIIYKSDISYSECGNNANVVEMLKNEMLTFALNRNLHVHVKVINMSCCINKTVWCFSTEGMITVGQDEVIFLLEFIENEKFVPKDIFYHINSIYCDAVKGTTVTELGLSLHNKSNFLDSKNHAGFLYIRPTLQCLQNVIIPKESYLIGVLIHRWETPWAKIFPLRLILRLGAEYRYYPSPIISTRDRESVFVEIGHTIINLLADFRNFSYTLPNIRGLTIHMEEKNTTVTIPTNRYDQVMKTLNNSSDHILAFGGNFSLEADSHLVCIQDTQGSNENDYTTHAININNKPRKITGASFIVFNGALKSSSGLTAKSSIIEDGLMIQIPPEHMVQVRENLKNMKNHTIQCGCVNAVSDETVKIIWGEPDSNFNIGVLSPIDKQPLAGVPSIRVHNGKDYVCNSGNRLIRWTEVFILQNGDELAKNQDPVDISKLAESISKATCHALVKYLDLLASNNFYKIGIRTTIQLDNVSYSAGGNGIKLPPIYMKSLDNELIPILHRITSNNVAENAIILELIFRILNV